MEREQKFYLIFILVVSFVISTFLTISKMSVDFGNAFTNDEKLPSISFKQIKLVEHAGGTGLEFGHTGRVWLNYLGGGSIVYNGEGGVVKTKNEMGEYVDLDVKIPGKVTGQVFSDENDFMGDAFIFTTLEGKIYGWHKDKQTGLEPLTATLRIDSSKNKGIYTGATSFKTKNGWRLYVADNANNKIETYDEKYNKVSSLGNFIDPDLSQKYTVNNLKVINNAIYVTYVNENNGAGGLINIFDVDGNFIKRLVTNNELDGPWGMAQAPDNFGNLGGKLLVGNTNTGEINVYDSMDGGYFGKVRDENGKVLKIPGLYALTYGTNNGAGRSNELFYSAGDSFGKLQLMSDNFKKENVTKQKDLNDQEKTEKEFLTQTDFNISYESFQKGIYDNCLENCLQVRLDKKLVELDSVYKKIFSDVEVVKKEFLLQGISVERLNVFLSQLKTLDPKSWQDFAEKECTIRANNFYTGIKLVEMNNICVLYKTENWLKELYTLRSIFIRVELGPLGTIQVSKKNILTKEFKSLIDEEESKVDKAY